MNAWLVSLIHDIIVQTTHSLPFWELVVLKIPLEQKSIIKLYVIESQQHFISAAARSNWTKMKAIRTSRAGKPESYCWFCDTTNLHLSLVPASITHYLNTHKQAYLRLFRSTCFCETEIWNRSGVYWKAHLKDLVIHGRKNILNHIFTLFILDGLDILLIFSYIVQGINVKYLTVKGIVCSNISFQTSVLLFWHNPFEKSFKYLLSISIFGWIVPLTCVCSECAGCSTSHSCRTSDDSFSFEGTRRPPHDLEINKSPHCKVTSLHSKIQDICSRKHHSCSNWRAPCDTLRLCAEYMVYLLKLHLHNNQTLDQYTINDHIYHCLATCCGWHPVISMEAYLCQRMNSVGYITLLSLYITIQSPHYHEIQTQIQMCEILTLSSEFIMCNCEILNLQFREKSQSSEKLVIVRGSIFMKSRKYATCSCGSVVRALR